MPDLLPPFVYDLISAVEKYEDEHAKGDDCLSAALERIPAQERDRAKAIEHYRRQQPIGVVEFPAHMTDEEIAHWRSEWDRLHGGPVEMRRAGEQQAQ
jgi:hypothetical protein